MHTHLMSNNLSQIFDNVKFLCKKLKKVHTINGDYMYYINTFFIYSILGFFLETLIAFITKSHFKSGILYGWWTPVYGLGVLTILFISKYLFKNLHMNRFIETIIVFFVVAIVLSTLEALGGVIIEKIFGTVFWDYSSQKYHIGPYISLEVTILWGCASVIFIYLIHPFLDFLIKKIPTSISIILICLFILDVIITFVNKHKIS